MCISILSTTDIAFIIERPLREKAIEMVWTPSEVVDLSKLKRLKNASTKNKKTAKNNHRCKPLNTNLDGSGKKITVFQGSLVGIDINRVKVRLLEQNPWFW